jgi:hypothetical protein
MPLRERVGVLLERDQRVGHVLEGRQHRLPILRYGGLIGRLILVLAGHERAAVKQRLCDRRART